MQARHNVHKSVLSLGAAVLGKISRLGHRIKQHHAHAREEGASMPPSTQRRPRALQQELIWFAEKLCLKCKAGKEASLLPAVLVTYSSMAVRLQCMSPLNHLHDLQGSYAG